MSKFSFSNISKNISRMRFKRAAHFAFYELLIALLVTQMLIPPQLAFAPPPPADETPSEVPSPEHAVSRTVELDPEALRAEGLGAAGKPPFWGVTDPRSRAILESIDRGRATPYNLDYIGSQSVRWRLPEGDGEWDSMPLTEKRFDRPVSRPNDFLNAVRVSANADAHELTFSIGKGDIRTPAFVPEVQHVVSGIDVAAAPIQNHHSLYLVTKKEGRLDAIRAMSIGQFIGNNNKRGAGFNHNIPITYALPLNHIPEDWELLNLEFLARSRRPRELLAIDSLQPVDANLEGAGGDLCLTFNTPDGEKHVWAPQEVVDDASLERLKHILLLALPDGVGVTPEEMAEVNAFLQGMMDDGNELDAMVAELEALNRAHAEGLTSSDLGRRALRAMNIGWMIEQLHETETEITNERNELVKIKQSKLSALYRQMRDRFSLNPLPDSPWARDYNAIQSRRAARGETGEASDETKSWAKDLMAARALDNSLLEPAEKAVKKRRRSRLGGLVNKMLTGTKLLFLGGILSGAGLYYSFDTQPIQAFVAASSNLVERAQQTPLRHVIEPAHEATTFVTESIQNGELGDVGLWGLGFGAALSSYFLMHLAAYLVGRARGQKGDSLIDVSFNTMFHLYLFLMNPAQKMVAKLFRQKNLYPWMLNTGERNPFTALNSPFASEAEIQANRDALNEAENAKQNLDFLASDLAACILAGEQTDTAPEVLMALRNMTTAEGGDVQDLDRAKIREATQALFRDPEKRARLLLLRMQILKSLKSMASKPENGIPVDGDIAKLHHGHYTKIAKELQTMDKPEEVTGWLTDAWTSLCQATSSQLMTLGAFVRDQSLGLNAAQFVERYSGRKVPQNVQTESLRRGVIDFTLSEGMGAALERQLFTFPQTIAELASKAPVITSSVEQSFAWLMIPPSNLIETMAGAHRLSNGHAPFESFVHDKDTKEQPLEASLLEIGKGLVDPDPNSPGIYKNWFQYIGAAFKGWQARSAYLATSFFIGFCVVKGVGSPEDAAQIDLLWAPVLSVISAFTVITGKIAIHGLNGVGYAIPWPAVDFMVDLNDRAADENLSQLNTATALLGSTDLALNQKGAALMKSLYHKGRGWFTRTSIPSELNIPADQYTHELAAQLLAYSVDAPPVYTRSNNLSMIGINTVATIFTTLIYFSLYKQLLGNPEGIQDALQTLGTMAGWFAATGATMWGMTKVSNVLTANITAPIAGVVGNVAEAAKNCANVVANTVRGADGILLDPPRKP